MIEFYLEDKRVTEFVEWNTSTLQAITRESEVFTDVDADIVLDDITLVRDAYKQLLSVYNDPAKGLFYKPSVRIVIDNYTFDGFIVNHNILGDTDKAVVTVVKQDGIFTLEDNLNALTVSYINEKQPYNQTSIKYLVEPLNRTEQALTMILAEFMYAYVLYKQVQDNAEQVANVVEASTPVGLPTPAPNFGAILSASLKAVASLTFTAVTVVNMIKTGKQLKEVAIPTKRDDKVTSLYELLNNPLNFLGYKLQTDLPLQNIYVWASKSVAGNTDVLNTSDAGYNVIEIFEFIQKKYNAKFKIKDNTVFLYWENSKFWDNNINYTLREDVVTTNFRYNTDDHIASYLVNYREDFSDEYTLERYKGTSYLVTSDNRDSLSDNRRSNVKGYFRTDFPFALANRKVSLTEFENVVNDFLKAINGAIKLFGGNEIKLLSNDRIGLPVISNPQFSVPKLVYLVNGKIPANHRDILSAKADYDNYHHSKSFVTNANKTLKKKLEDVRITYTAKDFFLNVENPYFKTKDGSIGKFTDVTWSYDRDYADANLEIRHKYTTNLKERFYESQR